MKKNLLVAPAFIVILAASFALPQSETPSKAREQELLARPIGVLTSSPMRLSIAFQVLLESARVPGGMILLEGCEVQDNIIRISGSTLRDGLRSITHGSPSYRWQARDRTVNLVPASGLPPLLKVRLRVFNSREANTMGWAGSLLAQTHEVQQAKIALGLQEAGTHTFLGAMPPGTLPKPSAPLSIRLEGVTVLQVLNAIVVAHKGGVWLYREIHCGSTNLFDINFTQ